MKIAIIHNSYRGKSTPCELWTEFNQIIFQNRKRGVIREICILVSAVIFLFTNVTQGITLQGKGYSVSNTASYEWMDISQTGTPISFVYPQGGAETVNVGFNFSLYGTTMDVVRVGTNGAIDMDPYGYLDSYILQSRCWNWGTFGNTSPGFIAPYFTEMDASGSQASVCHQTVGASGSRQFIIQWENVTPVGGGDPVSFQSILYEDTGEIKFQYKSINSTADVGIGIQGGNSDLPSFLHWSGQGSEIAPNPVNGTAITFSPDEPVDTGGASIQIVVNNNTAVLSTFADAAFNYYGDPDDPLDDYQIIDSYQGYQWSDNGWERSGAVAMVSKQLGQDEIINVDSMAEIGVIMAGGSDGTSAWLTMRSEVNCYASPSWMVEPNGEWEAYAMANAHGEVNFNGYLEVMHDGDPQTPVNVTKYWYDEFGVRHVEEIIEVIGEVNISLPEYIYSSGYNTNWTEYVVPEPATLSLLMVGGLALIRRR